MIVDKRSGTSIEKSKQILSCITNNNKNVDKEKKNTAPIQPVIHYKDLRPFHNQPIRVDENHKHR